MATDGSTRFQELLGTAWFTFLNSYRKQVKRMEQKQSMQGRLIGLLIFPQFLCALQKYGTRSLQGRFMSPRWPYPGRKFISKHQRTADRNSLHLCRICQLMAKIIRADGTWYIHQDMSRPQFLIPRTQFLLVWFPSLVGPEIFRLQFYTFTCPLL